MSDTSRALLLLLGGEVLIAVSFLLAWASMDEKLNQIRRILRDLQNLVHDFPEQSRLHKVFDRDEQTK